MGSASVRKTNALRRPGNSEYIMNYILQRCGCTLVFVGCSDDPSRANRVKKLSGGDKAVVKDYFEGHQARLSSASTAVRLKVEQNQLVTAIRQIVLEVGWLECA
jgi:hypothetical protein